MAVFQNMTFINQPESNHIGIEEEISPDLPVIKNNRNFAYCKRKYRVMVSRFTGLRFALLSTFSLWRFSSLWKVLNFKKV